jgi:hypothetical protein
MNKTKSWSDIQPDLLADPAEPRGAQLRKYSLKLTLKETDKFLSKRPYLVE